MNLRAHGVRRVTAIAITASVGAVGLLASACTPAPTTKVISGTIQGADGKIVDAMIGFEVRDYAGNHLDLGGGHTGYSVIQRVNHCVPASGATSSQACTYQGKVTQVTGKNWSLRVPSNAATVWIEVYPKDPTPTAWINNYNGYTGPATGVTNKSTYSTSERAQLVIGNGLSGVKIVMPKMCAAGGTTGDLAGHLSGWPLGHTGQINAWSLASNSLPDQGFATGTVDNNGNYRITGLQSGQRYGVIATGPGFSRNRVDYTRATTKDTLVNRCATTTFNF
jgi:hypothetical protein